jgi:REP element-mobilizing transposase RayT
MQYKQGYRCVYSLNIHWVLVTKYRRKMINQPILKRLNAVFWTGAYFVASTGGATLKQIKVYVENQQSPGD